MSAGARPLWKQQSTLTVRELMRLSGPARIYDDRRVFEDAGAVERVSRRGGCGRLVFVAIGSSVADDGTIGASPQGTVVTQDGRPAKAIVPVPRDAIFVAPPGNELERGWPT